MSASSEFGVVVRIEQDSITVPVGSLHRSHNPANANSESSCIPQVERLLLFSSLPPFKKPVGRKQASTTDQSSIFPFRTGFTVSLSSSSIRRVPSLGSNPSALLRRAFQRLANREQEDGALSLRVWRKEGSYIIIEEGQPCGTQALGIRSQVHLAADDTRL